MRRWQIFILSFSTAIADVLKSENDYIRVFSIEKNDDDEGNAKVDFGITTPEQVFTEILSNDMEVNYSLKVCFIFFF
jgi:hypothetical protein